MATKTHVARLRDDLERAGYCEQAMRERLGPEGHAGLTRNCTVPGLSRLGADDDPLALLIKLFPLQQTVPRQALDDVLDVTALLEAGILGPARPSPSATEQLRALVDVRPIAFEDELGAWSGWVAADPVPGMDHTTTRTRPDYVLSVSPASISLAQLTIPDRLGSALDLGTGCGIQALHLARHCARVVATDLNPRAVRMAQLTAQLNRLDVDVRAGSLYEPVSDERFELIVSNPPYVMSPPVPEDSRLAYREAGFEGDGLVRAVVRGAVARLAPTGTLQVLANWAESPQRSWQERLAAWVPDTGYQLWVVQRERLDIYQYIELWLTDAGLDGDPSWARRYQEWLDYFESLDITGVGMGWIMLRNSGVGPTEVTIEQWPYQIASPVGPAVSRELRARRFLHEDAEELWARRFRISPEVIQESVSQPGAADPSHIVLRQRAGLQRAMQVDTALAGVLGACDGELTLGTILDAVARLLGEEASALRARLLPELRRALAQGYLLDPAA
ncbi:Methyltransferase small domain-containing protein [Propionibacterium cyclohexanicum]|uniref:Methyltransferase small domain-containing protein n=1 Tax=Propionibacterium cyclohexanicum TaxID=64702 RepID=A0A1H9RVA7_9ACTN|nr:methyltransferase [Propionibacterium cyclohexanicum]SER76770.1 Methyltransferase small domain-containing protein [Propionibacterium cyclohexanicum]